MQPQIRSEDDLKQAPPMYDNPEEDIEDCMERRYGFNPTDWRKFKISIVLISKTQQVIINPIKEKRTIFVAMKNNMNK